MDLYLEMDGVNETRITMKKPLLRKVMLLFIRSISATVPLLVATSSN